MIQTMHGMLSRTHGVSLFWLKRTFTAFVLTTLYVSPLLAWQAEDFSSTVPNPLLAEVDPTGIHGSLVICGGGSLPDAAVQQFLQWAGGDEARLVVIPTASSRAAPDQTEPFAEPWRTRGVGDVQVLHTRDRATADSEEFVKPLTNATAVWFSGGQQALLAEAYVGTRVEQEIQRLLERGGVVGGTSAGAAIQSRLMIASGNPEARLMQGLDLIPGTVIDQHFKARRRQPRLTGVLAKYPGYLGLGIDEGTGLLVHERRVRVVGESTVTVCLAASSTRPARQYELRAGESLDLVALRRAAIARSFEAFPRAKPEEPRVPRGTLLIVGGGGMSRQMWQTFVEHAGGSKARIVVVPTADESPRLENRSDVRVLKEAGAETVTVLHTTDRAVADSDDFVAPLREATGIWFGGGRQWRLVDAYGGTATERAFHAVLERGGIIGGSSAGATIQGEYLVRGNPLGNREMMAEGYEQGFGFLPGAAIDQHFTQRGRQADMEHLKRTFPQLLGIGIDESTALVVQGSTAEVIGEHAAYFYAVDANQDSEQPAFTRVASGEAYEFRSDE